MAKANNIPTQTMIDEAKALATKGHVSGWQVVIGWFKVSPRRGRFGIRFQETPAVVDLGADGTFYPYLAFPTA